MVDDGGTNGHDLFNHEPRGPGSTAASFPDHVVASRYPNRLYVLLGVMMAGGGLADEIAGSLAELGCVYLFVMPFVAVLSGYITASGTGANAMFGATQVAAAQGLGVSPLWAMGLQNSAAGWAIIA